MNEEMVINGLAVEKVDGSGYIVALDAFDLSNWLRNGGHTVSEYEQSIANNIADIIDIYARAVLYRDLGV